MVWICEKGRGEVLGELGEVRVESVESCVMEDINLLGVEERVTQDRQMWRALIAHPTPS